MPGPYVGEIASEPENGRVDVIVPDLSRFQPIAECIYMPRGDVEPSPRDPCLVEIDKRGRGWVTVWEPS